MQNDGSTQITAPAARKSLPPIGVLCPGWHHNQGKSVLTFFDVIRTWYTQKNAKPKYCLLDHDKHIKGFIMEQMKYYVLTSKVVISTATIFLRLNLSKKVWNRHPRWEDGLKTRTCSSHCVLRQECVISNDSQICCMTRLTEKIQNMGLVETGTWNPPPLPLGLGFMRIKYADMVLYWWKQRW